MVLNDDVSAEQPSLWSTWMKNPYFASAVEVLFALVVSNAAIFIAFFVYVLLKPSQSEGLMALAAQTFTSSIRTTEIVVYILGFLAPAMWIMVTSLRAWRHVGFLILLLAVQLIVILSTSLIFALSIAKVLNNQAFANRWAWISLGVALVVWYVTLVYDKKVLKHIDQRMPRRVPGSDSGSALLKDLKERKK